MDMEEGIAAQGDALLVEEGRNASNTATTSNNATISDSTTEAMNQIPEMSVQEGKQMTKSQRCWNLIVTAVALSAMGFAVASVVLEGSSIVFVAFAFPLLSGPYVIWQRKILNKLPTLRYVINQTRQHINRLSLQNDKFSRENDRMAEELASLKQTEFQLYKVCQQQGTNVEDMRKLIAENGSIQKQMKKILDAEQVQDLLNTIIISDTNHDFQLTEREIDRLMLRLKGYSVVDQERLKETLRLYLAKSETEEWQRIVDAAEGGTLTGVKGWVL